MKHVKAVANILLASGLMTIALSTGGCKQQQQMQQQIEGMDGKVAESQKRLTALDSELKKTSFELQQLKSHIIKLTTVVTDMQKAEEDRLKASASKKAVPKAAAVKKPVPKRR